MVHKNIIHLLCRFGFWPVLVLVTGLSLWPGDASPPSSPWSDKFGHALAYFTLGGLVAIGWNHKSLRVLGILMAGLVAWSVMMELLQALPVIGRTCSVLDVLANASGVLLALTLVWMMGFTQKK